MTLWSLLFNWGVRGNLDKRILLVPQFPTCYPDYMNSNEKLMVTTLPVLSRTPTIYATHQSAELGL